MVTIPTSSASQGAKLPLRVKKSIKERYTEDIINVHNQARSLSGIQDLEFEPNFGPNYSLLAAFDATLNRDNGDDNSKLSEYWQDTLGQATREYFEGFVERLLIEKFGEEEMLREALAESLTAKVVEVRIVEGDVSGQIDGPCDCVFENGKLVIRTTVEKWHLSTIRCCDKMVEYL